jgi:glycosidase
LRFPLWAEDQPFRWRDALIYQVMTDRFADERGALAPDGWEADQIADRYGGTWAGLGQKLEEGYFDQLGVRALWISPVLDNPEGRWPGRDGHEHMGYHSYWPASPEAMEPAFGEPEELDALVEAAHARGMRVLIDVVPNHLHESHPYRARHPDWFNENPDCICGAEDCPWDSEIETCWFTEYLPDLDWTHPEVAPTLTADLVALAEATNADGFRVDAVPMMPRAAVRELAWTLGQRFEAGPVDFYLLGEIFTGASGQGDIRRHLGPHALDGAFDFPVMWALRGYAAGDWTGEELEQALQQSEAAWAGSGSVMSPFLGNHDVSRITSELAGQVTSEPWTNPPDQPYDPTAYARLRLALTLLHALPGAPTIYQGDEIGMAGANDPDNRRPMRFAPALEAEQLLTLDRAQALGQARAAKTALRRGERLPLAAQGGAIAWLRDSGDQRPALLVANAGAEAEALRLRLPGNSLPRGGLDYIDAANPTFQLRLLPDREIQIQLPPLTARLLVPAEP